MRCEGRQGVARLALLLALVLPPLTLILNTFTETEREFCTFTLWCTVHNNFVLELADVTAHFTIYPARFGFALRLSTLWLHSCWHKHSSQRACIKISKYLGGSFNICSWIIVTFTERELQFELATHLQGSHAFVQLTQDLHHFDMRCSCTFETTQVLVFATAVCVCV